MLFTFYRGNPGLWNVNNLNVTELQSRQLKIQLQVCMPSKTMLSSPDVLTAQGFIHSLNKMAGKIYMFLLSWNLIWWMNYLIVFQMHHNSKDHNVDRALLFCSAQPVMMLQFSCYYWSHDVVQTGLAHSNTIQNMQLRDVIR